MLLATLALAVLVSAPLGLLGGGGSILILPILIYVAGQSPKEAVAPCLVVAVVSSSA